MGGKILFLGPSVCSFVQVMIKKIEFSTKLKYLILMHYQRYTQSMKLKGILKKNKKLVSFKKMLVFSENQ